MNCLSSAVSKLDSIICKSILAMLMFVSFCFSDTLEAFERDVPVEEYLQSVKQTRQDLLFSVAGIKKQKPRDIREGLYAQINVGIAYATSIGTSSVLGLEVGYDFIFGKRHSLRVFGFFDRTNHNSFADMDFDASKTNAFQLYRAGLSAEYRIYAGSNIGFRLRVGSLGAYNLSFTGQGTIPTLEQKRVKGFYPTVAIGVFLYWGRTHEIFVGYDLLDYDKTRGMNVNYLKYSYRF